MSEVRTRFSPSPTGMMHLGNARTALFSALYAKKNNGTFILRIEDTDSERSQDHFVTALEEDLKWLSVNWQEGPKVDGAYGPYWQSQRQSIYAKYYKILEDKKLIYPCFCSDKELNLARKIQLSRGHAPRYGGTCLKLSEEDIAKKIQEGQRPAWRFKVPHNEAIEFIDIVKGPQRFQSDDIGDFIVRRADGTAPFLFCNAIDDAMMKVSHVLRGEDHLANTPRQLMLLEVLNLHTPQYGHLSLITGDDGTPLSKRHGSFSVFEMREQGYVPSAIINYLARLGHTCDVPELLTFNQLAQHFHLEKLSRSPARFDHNQLMYWQKTAVLALDVNGIWQWLGHSIMDQVPEKSRQLFAETVRANVAFPKDAMMWAHIFFSHEIPIDPSELLLIKEAGEQYFVEAELAVEKYGIDFANVLNEMKQTLGVAGKKLFMPLRIALTGKTFGPELNHIASILGKEKIKERLSNAFKRATMFQ